MAKLPKETIAVHDMYIIAYLKMLGVNPTNTHANDHNGKIALTYVYDKESAEQAILEYYHEETAVNPTLFVQCIMAVKRDFGNKIKEGKETIL